MKKIITIGLVMVFMLSGCAGGSSFNVSVELKAENSSELSNSNNVEFMVKDSSEVVIHYKWSFEAELASMSIKNKETDEVVWYHFDFGQAEDIEGDITLPAISGDANYELIVVGMDYTLVKVEFTSTSKGIEVKE